MASSNEERVQVSSNLIQWFKKLSTDGQHDRYYSLRFQTGYYKKNKEKKKAILKLNQSFHACESLYKKRGL